MAEVAFDEYGVEETLDAVESTWLETVSGNAEIFRLAAHYADVCAGEGLPAGRSGRAARGGERSVRLGGPGTPRVREFAAAEFGARIRLGTVGARHLIADALDARHRLPKLWARLAAGQVRVGWVRQVASRTRDLSVEAAGWVDAELVQIADGRVPWSRFCAVLEGKIVAADPEAAARREADRRAEVFARAARGGEHGIKGFYLRAPIALVVRFDATVAYLAEALRALGDTDPEDARRVKACAILANPTQAVELLAAFARHRAHPDQPTEPAPDEGDPEQTSAPEGSAAQARDTEPDPEPDPEPEDEPDPEPEDEPEQPAGAADPRVPAPFSPAELPAWLRRATDPDSTWRLEWPRLLPPLWINLHLAQETLDAGQHPGPGGGVVRWEGQDPVTVRYVREMLAPYHDVRVLPVLDLAGQAPVDGYEIPARHSRAVHLRTPADSFPYSSNTTDAVDVDHTEEYERAPDGSPAAPGQSRMGNYGPLGRFHHRIKTHGAWQVKQPYDGIYLWRDPHGHYYLVDHTGTRKITPPRRREPSYELQIIEPDFDIVLDDDFPVFAA